MMAVRRDSNYAKYRDKVNTLSIEKYKPIDGPRLPEADGACQSRIQTLVLRCVSLIFSWGFQAGSLV